MLTSRRSPRAFTLVELLVVIGIISLLISILLPSLARARQSASLLSCQSNFKQVYNALMFYANDNKGYLPRAADGDWSEPWLEADIMFTLTPYLGSGTPRTTGGEPYGPIAPALFCSERLPDGTGNVWFPSVKNMIKFHPRAFPGADQVGWNITGSDGVSKPGNVEYPQRKLASIKSSADKIAFWDGGQILSWNACTEPGAINLDGWRWNWTGAHYYLDPPPPAYDMNRWNVPIDEANPGVEPNGWWEVCVRTRHMNNTVTPVAFFDGHVEARKAKEILVRDICISK